MAKLPPFGLFPTPITISGRSVLAGAAAGAVIGKPATSVPGLTLSVVSGAFTINGAGQLVSTGVAGAAGTTSTVRIRATRANPFLQVDQDFVISAVADTNVPVGVTTPRTVVLPQTGNTALAPDLSAVPAGNMVTVTVPAGSAVDLRYLN